MNIVNKFILLIAIVALQASAHAGTHTLSIYEGQSKKIQLQLPDSWDASNERLNTIRVKGIAGAGFSFLITAFPLPAEKQKTIDVREIAQFEIDRIGPSSANSPLVLKNFGDSKSKGVYFCATDSAPKPGEFKYMQQAVMSVDGSLVIATVLTNESKDAIEEQALEVIKSIRFVAN